MQWHQPTARYIWPKGTTAQIGKECRCWYAELPAHHQHDIEAERVKLFFQRQCLAWCIREMMWSDKLVSASPLLCQWRLYSCFSAKRALICWAQNNPVAESCCALPHRICLKVVSLDNILREKTLLTRIGIQYGQRCPGLEKERKRIKEVMMGRVKQKNCHGRWSQSTAFQGRASHLSASTSSSSDWCHRQLLAHRWPEVVNWHIKWTIHNSLCTPNDSSLAQGQVGTVRETLFSSVQAPWIYVSQKISWVNWVTFLQFKLHMLSRVW